MRTGRLRRLAHLAWRMPGYVGRPLDTPRARDAVRQRLDRRQDHFLELAQRCIYAWPASPYCRLLTWAGCTLNDLSESVRRRGLEHTLTRLRDQGVYLTADEFRAYRPICRPGLTVDLQSSSFDNPHLDGAGFEGSTSASASRGVTGRFTWELFAQEAATERLLLEAHGLVDAPIAMWMPGPPGIAGVHNLLIHLAMGQAPRRWFSHVGLPSLRRSPLNAVALRAIGHYAAACGQRAPRLEHVPFEAAGSIAQWLSGAAATHGVAALKTYASSAVRMAKAAADAGLDITRCIVFTGGEALSAQRYAYLCGAGLRAYPRYASTEAGMMGSSCGRCACHDQVHLYTDRLAVVPRIAEAPDRSAGEREPEQELLFTSLSTTTPRVLLNASIGDWGRIETRDCDCPFGQLGMNVHVSGLTSPEKLTSEGMNLDGAALSALIEPLIAQVGGAPDDFQVWVSHDGAGLDRLCIAVSPDLARFDEAQFMRSVRRGLATMPDVGPLAADLWRQADTLRVIRAQPQRTRGHKLLPIIAHPGAAAMPTG